MARASRNRAARRGHRHALRRSAGAAQRPRDASRDSVRRLSRHRLFGRLLLRPYTFGMVLFAHAPLTRVGFRRDLRLFLGILVGFLVVMILLLVVMLQIFLQHTHDVMGAGWNAVADSAVRDLAAGARADP